MTVAAQVANDVALVRVKLGLPAAPVVVKGLEEACAFFREHLKVDPALWLDYLRGIQFHDEVVRRTLPVGTALSQHVSGTPRSKPFVYFTVPGTSPFSTGTSFPSSEYRKFRTPREMLALVSTASSISFNALKPGVKAENAFDRIQRGGGGRQYILSATDAAALRRER